MRTAGRAVARNAADAASPDRAGHDRAASPIAPGPGPLTCSGRDFQREPQRIRHQADPAGPHRRDDRHGPRFRSREHRAGVRPGAASRCGLTFTMPACSPESPSPTTNGPPTTAASSSISASKSRDQQIPETEAIRVVELPVTTVASAVLQGPIDGIVPLYEEPRPVDRRHRPQPRRAQPRALPRVARRRPVSQRHRTADAHEAEAHDEHHPGAQRDEADESRPIRSWLLA